MVGGAYLRDKNTYARTTIKNVGGLYAKGGVYAGCTVHAEYRTIGAFTCSPHTTSVYTDMPL